MRKYKIVRMYAERPGWDVIVRNLTLEGARAYCNDPETSSRTATSDVAKERTAKVGAWFDGYTMQED